MKLYNFSDLTSFKYNNIVIGATAVIGVIGGIYLLTQSTKLVTSRIAERKTIKKKKDEQFCNVCLAPIDTEDLKTCIACSLCAKYVCRDRDKCSEWVPKDGEWRCQLCSAKSDSYGKTSTWVEEQLSVKKVTPPPYAHPMRARSEIYIPLCDPNDSAFLCNFESVSEAPSSINVSQKLQIREYIEEVLAEMLGGSLDSTTVGPLTRNDSCAHTAPGNEHELQGISHVRLRRLIESIIAETVRVPGTTNVEEDPLGSHQNLDELTTAYNGNGNHCNGNVGQYFAPKKYQDLLATAVLNKIVDTHGNGRHSESSPDLSASAFDKNHNSLYPNKTDESISSSCSIEPRSESSLTDPLHNINKGDVSYGNYYADVANENIEADNESVLSDFIASHMVPLPHISAEPASDEDEEGDEDFISVASSGRDATWEDNWLFKKRKSGKTASSVGMLVPAPKEDVRALIGDKPTDEVSDLSEVGSDTDDSSMEMVSANMEPLNGRLVNQHLIGGKNTKVVLDELVEQSSLISTSSLPEDAPPYTETKNDFVVSNDGLSDSEPSKISVSNCNAAVSNEAVNANVTKAVPNNTNNSNSSPTADEEPIVPPPNDFTDDEKMRSLMAKFTEEQGSKMDSGDDNSSSLSPRSSISGALSGSIAEREYKKWYNAVDMPNNPYSAEALKRRLSGGPERVIDLPNISPSCEENPIVLGGEETKPVDDKSQERDYARYSRDYYINDAKHASGATKKRVSPATTPSPSAERSLPQSSAAPPAPAPSSSSSSSIEMNNRSEGDAEPVQLSPVKAMCHKLEKQSRTEREPDLYTATPARVEEEIPEPQPAATVVPLTTEAVRKLSSETSSAQTTESLTPSEDSDTIRIYDLKKQETRIVKDTPTGAVPKSPVQKLRPTDLEIAPTFAAPAVLTPSLLTPTSKSSTPTSFKFLQPKRKLINPSQVLSIDQENPPVSPLTTEKTVIEEDVVQALPSVKALAKAFLLTSATCTTSDKWRKGRTKSPTPLVKTATTPATIFIQKPPEPPVADTTSQGSEDATIASDLSSLETDPPSRQETDSLALTRQPNQERPLSPVLVPGCLKNNIAFFENLKNK